jgi:histidinol phosphatase-like enzyme
MYFKSQSLKKSHNASLLKFVKTHISAKYFVLDKTILVFLKDMAFAENINIKLSRKKND